MTDWIKTSAELAFTPEHIDIWLIDLAAEARDIFTHQRYLSADELTRADKYVSGVKAREFIITRSALRNVIAFVLKENPRHISFGYTRHGMPVLDGNWDHTGITFNVSHSHDYALIAVTQQHALGIDIELMRDNVAYERLAGRFFSEAEYHSIMAQQPERRLHAFYSTWTRKEAIVKATGTGIAYGLDKFDVNTDPDAAPELLATRWQEECQRQWSLHTIDVATDYEACIAVAGAMPALRYWRL